MSDLAKPSIRKVPTVKLQKLSTRDLDSQLKRIFGFVRDFKPEA